MLTVGGGIRALTTETFSPGAPAVIVSEMVVRVGCARVLVGSSTASSLLLLLSRRRDILGLLQLVARSLEGKGRFDGSVFRNCNQPCPVSPVEIGELVLELLTIEAATIKFMALLRVVMLSFPAACKRSGSLGLAFHDLQRNTPFKLLRI